MTERVNLHYFFDCDTEMEEEKEDEDLDVLMPYVGSWTGREVGKETIGMTGTKNLRKIVASSFIVVVQGESFDVSIIRNYEDHEIVRESCSCKKFKETKKCCHCALCYPESIRGAREK